MRSIENIINSFRVYLREENSALAEFSEYSNLYVLARAIAGVVLEQETLLENLKTSQNLLTATGVDLDNLALLYGQYRKNGVPSQGYCLIKSESNYLLDAGAVLIDRQNENAFTTLNSTQINSVEQAIEIQSVENKNIFLNAGETLELLDYPASSVVVGLYRNSSDNLPQENIDGGRDIELDSEFRQRILTSFTKRIDLKNYLEEAILNNTEVLQVAVVDNTPIQGVFTVFIDSIDKRTKDLVADIVTEIKPLGSNFEIAPLKSVPVDFEINVVLNNYENINAYKLKIAQAIDLEFSNLFNIREDNFEIKLSRLTSVISNLSFIQELEIINPSSNLIKQKNELLKIGSLNLNFKL